MKAAGQTLRAPLAIYARHLPALLLTAGLLLLPVAVIKLLAGYAGDWPLTWFQHDGLAVGLEAGPWKTAGDVAVGVFEFLVQILSYGVVTLFLARALSGRPVDWRTAWQQGLARTRPMLTSSLAALLPTIGFMFLFMLPGAVLVGVLNPESAPLSGLARVSVGLLMLPGFLFISVRLVYLYDVAIVEGTGGFAAYRRNLGLLEGRFWSVAAVVLPIELVRHLARAVFDWLVLSAPLKDALTSGVTWLLMPLEIAAALLLYMQARGAQEPAPGYDGARLGADLDNPPGPGRAAD